MGEGHGWAHGGRRRGGRWMVDDGRMHGRVGSRVDGGVGGCALRGATVDTVVSRSQLTLSPVVWPSIVKPPRHGDFFNTGECKHQGLL